MKFREMILKAFLNVVSWPCWNIRQNGEIVTTRQPVSIEDHYKWYLKAYSAKADKSIPPTAEDLQHICGIDAGTARNAFHYGIEIRIFKYDHKKEAFSWADKAKFELLPCPFCGEDAFIFGDEEDPTDIIHVVCSSCSASGPEKATKQGAAEAWNRRTGDDDY